MERESQPAAERRVILPLSVQLAETCRATRYPCVAKVVGRKETIAPFFLQVPGILRSSRSSLIIWIFYS